ncbi:MAG: prepilin-type N-terminal cleavage/methylation domain-containing protein [Anaerorhabdus sp.]|uniref:prepilin-type N-terminal cleavage/methylation domain-containing protein n=1 Tax=Anaerorhabdus sp. TaxID=1872524 RepID=UPI002FCA924C
MNKKGFTLIELITVIAILAVLGTVLIPSVSGYVGSSKDVVCISNVNMLNRTYRMAAAMNENLKAEDVLKDKTGKYFGGTADCPSDGDYVVVNNVIECTKHKNGNQGGGTTPGKDPEITDLYERMLDALSKSNGCSALTDLTQKGECYKAFYGSNVFYWNASEMCEKIFRDKGNSWDPLDPLILEKAGIKNPNNDTYYIKPYFGEKSQTPIIFANTTNKGSGNWYTNLVCVEGIWYKSDKSFSMTEFNQRTIEESTLYIKTNFKPVEL